MTKLERLEEELKTADELAAGYIKYQIKDYLKLNAFGRKLADYEDVFDEPFPRAMAMGLDEDEIVKLIDEAIETGEPYDGEEDLKY